MMMFMIFDVLSVVSVMSDSVKCVDSLNMIVVMLNVIMLLNIVWFGCFFNGKCVSYSVFVSVLIVGVVCNVLSFYGLICRMLCV